MQFAIHHRIKALLTRTALALLAGIGSSGHTLAYTTVTFSGVVDSVSPGYAIPGIGVGDTLSGSLDYDPSILDGNALSWIGYYPGAIFRFNATIGASQFALSSAFATPPSEIDVINDDFFSGTYRDSLYFRVGVEEASNPGVVRFLQLTFSTSAATPPSLLLNDTLPSAPDLGAFGTRRGFLTYNPPGASQGNNFALTSVAVSPIPEADSWLMFFAGLALLAHRIHRLTRRH